MMMLQKLFSTRSLGRLGAAVLAFACATPAVAGPLYAWRSDEGTFAFTDDPKRIPPRYREQAKVRPMKALRDYDRFTPQDPVAVGHYGERLAARLDALRRVGAERPERRAGEPTASHTVALRTGGEGSPSLELRQQGGDQPLMVETLFTRPHGKMVTRQSVVVRQGDRTLAVVKPRLREWNVSEDIHDEASLR